MTREDLALTLENIALLLELKGENPFKIRAYRTGADTVMQFSGDIVEKAENNDLGGIKGIGEALRKKLHELGFLYVTMDLDGFKSGSLNAALRRK